MIFYCDNEATVYINDKGRSKVQPIMRLMRRLRRVLHLGNL